MATKKTTAAGTIAAFGLLWLTTAASAQPGVPAYPGQPPANPVPSGPSVPAAPTAPPPRPIIGYTAPTPKPEPTGFFHRLYNRCANNQCQTHHNDFGCGSGKADCVFIFGSCRAFWGDPCYKGPPRAYENWPGVFKP